MKETKEKLDGENKSVGQKDLVFIGIFGGGSVMLFLFLFYFALSTPEQFFDTRIWTRIEATGPVMRCTFFFTYMLFAVGLGISIFIKAEINYSHIFELDER